MPYAVLYVCVSCFVVRGCAVSRRYIDVYYCYMFSVVNVYHDHLKFCVLMVEGMSVVVNVMLSLMSVMKYECYFKTNVILGHDTSADSPSPEDIWSNPVESIREFSYFYETNFE